MKNAFETSGSSPSNSKSRCENCGIKVRLPQPEQWVKFIAAADAKVYKIHPDHLQMAQYRGLIKTVLGKAPFSEKHCDLCCSMLAAVCLPHFARAQEEFERENLRLFTIRPPSV
jgi:hypothetical protein